MSRVGIRLIEIEHAGVRRNVVFYQELTPEQTRELLTAAFAKSGSASIGKDQVILGRLALVVKLFGC